MEILYLIYCIIVYIEYFPKFIKLFKTKSSNDYSVGSTILSLVGMFCWVVYLFTTEQDLILYVGSVVDISLNVLFAILVIRYQNNV